PPRTSRFPYTTLFRSRFQRSEGFRSNNEESLRRIEIKSRLHELAAINVRDETEGHVALAIVLQRLIGHGWTQIGATNTNVDNIRSEEHTSELQSPCNL